jgi:hypothetical protein
VPHQRGVAGSAARSDEQIVDGPLQDVVGRQADCVPHPALFQGLIEGGQGKRRVRADDHRVALGAVPINDGKEDLVPPVRTVDVAGPEFGREAVALRVEHEERLIADGGASATGRDPVEVALGSALSFVALPGAPTTVSVDFTIAVTELGARLSFSDLVPRNNFGPILDNIQLTRTQSIPAPASLLLFGSGLTALGGFAARRPFPAFPLLRPAPGPRPGRPS